MTFSSRPFSLVLFSCLCMAIAILAQRPNLNICDWILCENGGICQKAENSTNGYRCRCGFGFTGLLCESRVNITTCGNNPCLNKGNCTLTSNGLIKCTCLKQYKGDRCEILI